LGVAPRDVEHTGITTSKHSCYLATACPSIPKPAPGVEEGYMVVETIHLDDLDALVADGSLKDETTVLGLSWPATTCATGAVAVTGTLPRTPRNTFPGSRSSGDVRRARCRPYRRDLGTYQEGLPGHGIGKATSADVAAHLEMLRRSHNAASVAGPLQHPGLPPLSVEEGLRGDDPTLDLPPSR